MSTGFLRPGLAALAVALGLAVPSGFAGDGRLTRFEAATPGPAPTAAGVASNTWFVEMGSPPTADGTGLTKIKSEQAAFRAEAKSAGITFNERYSFQKLWNGLSVHSSPGDATAMSLLPGVKSVSPVGIVQAPSGETADPDLATAIKMTGADVVQDDLGFDGSGVAVAIMDTGVDYDHPDLGGNGTDTDTASDDSTFDANFPNSRVVGGWDFVGDTYSSGENATNFQPVPHPDADPDDCNGHGTHVAGIVGADKASGANGALGVAPGVTIRAYRVFGCSGSTTDDVMIAAMERILADGNDVLNMSIGDAFNNWPGAPTAAASDRLVNHGVSVVASIGNSGANGVWSAGAPGVGSKVIGVASFDNSHIRAPGFTVSPDDHAVPYTKAVGAGSIPAPPNPPTSGTVEIKETAEAAAVGKVPPDGTGTYPGGTTFPDGCSAFPANYFAGKVALIRRGTCTFTVKAQNAEAAGASAVVLYNHSPGGVTPQVAATPQVAIPVVAILKAEGELIHNRLADGPVSITWQTDVSAVNPTGGLISLFSSYGMAADLTLKPDIGAPGGLIRSTYPLEKGAYNTISGTSMASPHVAGAVALLLQAQPRTSPQGIRSMLQNTAQPAPWSGNPGLGLLDIVYRQGAGMLRIDRTIQATAGVTPGKLSLGESDPGPQTRTLTVSNRGGSSVTYDLSFEDAISTSRTFPNPAAPTNQLGFQLGESSVAFTQLGVPITALTVPARSTASFEVTISPDPTLEPKSLYGGYLYLTPAAGYTLRVPFAGFFGDYQSIDAITSGGDAGLPKLARHVDYIVGPDPVSGQPAIRPKYQPQSGTPIYTMGSTPDPDADTQNRPIKDIPFVAVHFDHQVRNLKAEVFDAATNKRLGLAFDLDYLARNDVATANFTDSTGFTALAWGGKVKKGNGLVDVADGNYYVKLSALEALGDAANPAHVETWTSPTFTIDRP